MNWFDDENKSPHRRQERTGFTQIDGISDIPIEATPDERFRLTAVMPKIIERETKDGRPYYFLHCQDEGGTAFSVVCWDWQWPRLERRVKEGKSLVLDVRVPKDGFSAFTLG